MTAEPGVLYNEPCEVAWARIADKSLDMIGCDPPFNASGMTEEGEIGGFEDHVPIKRNFGGWDQQWSPLHTLEQAARTLRPGGWLVMKAGDRTFGPIREMGECDPVTMQMMIDWMVRLGLVVPHYRQARDVASLLAYKATVAWHKTNPVIKVRTSAGFLSSMEWLQIFRRLNDDGTPAPPVAWNFISQTSMHNFIEGGNGSNEKFYWHIAGGQVVPCPPKKADCPHCTPSRDNRLSHPTQTPMYVWKWVFERMTVPGMVVYDPYAGTGSTLRAAWMGKFGLDIFGSEIDPVYCRVYNMWRDGLWRNEKTIQTPGLSQLSMDDL